MAIVSTGQFTIVDNNDARPITAFVTASGPTQQIFTKDESTTSWVPDWTSSNLVFTAKVYVGGSSTATEVASTLTNKKWSTSIGGSSLGSGTTYTINTNLAEGSAPVTYYFEGDYSDPTTALVSHVIAQITISQVKTGTNAVYIEVNGQNVIEQATGSTKNQVTLSANLMRAAGVDNTGVTYQWYKSPFGATDQIDGNYTDGANAVGTLYGFQDTAAFTANRVGVIGQYQTTAGSTTAAISTSNIPDGGWSDLKAMVISELAINNIGLFLVKAKDAIGTIYQQYFSVYDVSDQYQVIISSSSGDKLQNGVGSTQLSPLVYYGATQLASLTGWTFTWYFYDRNGNRGAFVDTNASKLPTGAAITANTTGATASFSCASITAGMFVAGDIIKCVKATDGTAYFYEVGATSTAGSVSIRTPSTNTFLNFTNYPSPSATTDFVGGTIFAALATRSTSAGAAITLTGSDIDVKGKVSVDANRP